MLHIVCPKHHKAADKRHPHCRPRHCHCWHCPQHTASHTTTASGSGHHPPTPYKQPGHTDGHRVKKPDLPLFHAAGLEQTTLDDRDANRLMEVMAAEGLNAQFEREESQLEQLDRVWRAVDRANHVSYRFERLGKEGDVGFFVIREERNLISFRLENPPDAGGVRYDWLGICLKPYELLDGGYISFWDGKDWTDEEKGRRRGYRALVRGTVLSRSSKHKQKLRRVLQP